MALVHVRFSTPRSPGYEILIAPGLLGHAGRELKARFKGHHPFLISSPTVDRLWGGRLRASLKAAGLPLGRKHLVPDGERHKTFGEYGRALAALAKFGKGSQVRPLGLLLGGGVLGDLGGFACATYKRGLPFVQIPSTLLAMVDSSVGGKLGVDFDTPQGRIKNLVGCFHQPALVLIDPHLASTLPPRELRAGLAEVVKTAVIFDTRLFSALEGGVSRLLAADPAALANVVRACAAHKAKVVMKDEFDVRGQRALLNLGHTFGHAIEAASGFKVLHGEAVAVGLACACDLALRLRVAAPDKARELGRVEALLRRLGLATRLPGFPLRPALAAMAHDKKFEAVPRFILPERLGRCVVKTLHSLAPVRAVLMDRFRRS